MTATRLIAMALTAMLLTLSACQQFPQEPPRAGEVETDMLKVVTFNIRYGNAQDGPDRWDSRRHIVLETIRGFDADVLGLQEALAFQADEIAEALPEYGMISTCRDDGQRRGEACPILYRRDRFEAIDSGTFWFSQTPETPGSRHWGNTLPRICTWALLRDRAAGERFYVYNLHLDHESQPSRLKSLELLAERISRRSPQAPFVVMGDFNIQLDNPAMRALLGEPDGGLQLADSWKLAHPGETPVATFHKFTGQPSPNAGKIDHILVSQDTPVIDAGIERRSFDGRWPSDHFPVCATINLYAK